MDDAASKWISPQPSYTGGQTDPAGAYTYQTTFSLAGFIATTTSLTFQLATDNATTDVLLNGVSTGITYGSYSTLSSPFTLSGAGFVSGTNTLSFVTRNDAGTSGNPAGLRVLISGTAALIPEPGPAGLVLLAAGVGSLWLVRRKLTA